MEEGQKEMSKNLDRSGLDPATRISLTVGLASLVGFVFGGGRAAQLAGLQYLAENAHVLPKTKQGWYFYHKTKNYRMALAGMKGGANLAFRSIGLVLLYQFTELSLDYATGEARWFGSVFAGAATGTLVALKSRLPIRSRRLALSYGLVLGGISGAVQELHRWRSALSKQVLMPSRKNSSANIDLQAGNPVLLDKTHRTISLYQEPRLVLKHFGLYTRESLKSHLLRWLSIKRLLGLSLLATACWVGLNIPGPHQKLWQDLVREASWAGYWILLGVASSIGLGTGLHTFVLFLGPYIAQVTMIAYECGHVKFNSNSNNLSSSESICDGGIPGVVTLWQIYYEVQWECFCWGLGTALGELPPYFMARTARLSGQKLEELAEIEALTQLSLSELSWKDWVMVKVHGWMQRLGFIGILLFASIPNPLFDLAGILCGHFLIPFTTFFGATLIGKAIIKASIQALFVITVFGKDSLHAIMDLVKSVFPSWALWIEGKIQQQIYLLTHKSLSHELQHKEGGWIPMLWNLLIAVMMGYFALSIVESLGVQYFNELQQRRERKQAKDH